MIRSLSHAMNFEVRLVTSLNDFVADSMDGLVLEGNELSSAELAEALKRFHSILVLDSERAFSLITPTLASLADESSVELMVAGPPSIPDVFELLSTKISSPYYVRIIKEVCDIASLNFGSLYDAIYWNAFFAEAEIGKIKVKALPALELGGMILYGRTESVAGSPVDIWYSNVGFAEVNLVRLFVQDAAAEVDCITRECRMRVAGGDEIKMQMNSNADYHVYVESFIRRIQGNFDRSSNISAWQFIRLKELYEQVQQNLSL